MSKQRIKKFKLYVSYQKERSWLEEMALQGWFLENISFGVFYTFVRGEPRRMLYDIDRFWLPKKPVLEEIRHKETFRELAQEMGWKEVTHSEDMTYYFTKEYEEDGVNELHNDPESRRYLAEKFKEYYYHVAMREVFWGAVLVITDILVKLLTLTWEEPFPIWYDWFVLVFFFAGSLIALWCRRKGEDIRKELSMSRQEWEERVDPETHRTVRKLIWTNRGLNRFLRKQEEQGWILTSVTPTRYFFEKSQGKSQVYTMDCKSLTNSRRKKGKQKKFEDSKDWYGINNDWELQSVRDAEEKGWTFVCALENRAIIYRGDVGEVQPLNDVKYDNSLRGISLIGKYGFLILCSGFIGGVIGFIFAMFYY